MPNLQQIMGEEIRRLARKELKNAIEPLKAQIIVLRKTISEQNKRIQSLEKVRPVIPPKTKEQLSPPVQEPVRKIRIAPERIKKIRKKLSLSQIQFATLLGVSNQSVNRWEAGVSVPRAEQKARLAAVSSMGKHELFKLMEEKGIQNRQESDGKKTGAAFDHSALTTFREAHKLTKVQLAALLGVSQFSVGHWESGKSEPRDAQKNKISALLALPAAELQTALAALPVKSARSDDEEKK